MSGRFQKGQSGNPAGRPKARRPHISAFDVIFDKKLTVSQNGIERELTIDEALQLQTYQAALKGSKMAVRAVLKMIEKRRNDRHHTATELLADLRNVESTLWQSGTGYERPWHEGPLFKTLVALLILAVLIVVLILLF